MYRDILNKLNQWKKSPSRKPLVLLGARQVGKTWVLKEFGNDAYKKVAFASMDRDEAVCQLLRTETRADRLLRGLSAILGIDITPGDTLLILDEIQDCPEALSRLKVFCEDAPQYHVAVAGSLLGISLHAGVSYPVGKVDEMTLFPMTFQEFLLALGKNRLADIASHHDWDLLKALSGEYIDLLRQYYYVGGMPAAVLTYISGGGLKPVRQIQNQILKDYERDFGKHAPAEIVPRIHLVWQSLVAQLTKENKKFIYGCIKKGARANQFKDAIQWLMDAGLVYKIYRVNDVRLPLKFYEDRDAFKLFMLEVGLLGAMAQAPAAAILVGNDIFKEYKGAFTEVYVYSQLVVTGMPIYYFTAERSRIELDFVIQLAEKVYPLEIKAEENVKAKSMRVFINNHPELTGLRISMKDHINQGWLENLPLYAFAGYLGERAY